MRTISAFRTRDRPWPRNRNRFRSGPESCASISRRCTCPKRRTDPDGDSVLGDITDAIRKPDRLHKVRKGIRALEVTVGIQGPAFIELAQQLLSARPVHRWNAAFARHAALISKAHGRASQRYLMLRSMRSCLNLVKGAIISSIPLNGNTCLNTPRAFENASKPKTPWPLPMPLLFEPPNGKLF